MLTKLMILALFVLNANICAQLGEWKKLSSYRMEKQLVGGLWLDKQGVSQRIKIKCADGEITCKKNHINEKRIASLVQNSHFKTLYFRSKNDQENANRGVFNFSGLSEKQVRLLLKYSDPQIDGQDNLSKLDLNTLYGLYGALDYFDTQHELKKNTAIEFARKLIEKMSSKDKSGQQLIEAIKKSDFNADFKKSVNEYLSRSKIKYSNDAIESVSLIPGVARKLTLGISPQGNYVMTSDPHQSDFKVYDMTNKQCHSYSEPWGMNNRMGCFSFDEKYFAVPTDKNKITIFEIKDSVFQPVHTIDSESTFGTHELFFSKDGNRLVIYGNNIKIVTIPTKSQFEIPLASSGSQYYIGLTNDGKYIKADCFTGKSFIWNLAANKSEKDFTKFVGDQLVETIALHPDALMYAIGRKNGVVELRDFNTDQLKQNFQVNKSDFSSLPIIKFDDSGKYFIIAHNNYSGNKLTVFDMSKNTKVLEHTNNKVIRSVDIVDEILVEQQGAFIKLFNLNTKKSIKEFDSPATAAVSKDKSAIVHQNSTGIHLIKLSERMPLDLKTHEMLQVIHNENCKPGIGGKATLDYFLEQKNTQNNENNNNSKEEEQ